MNSVAMDNLLAFIRSKEGGPGARGYGQIYTGAKGVPKNTDVSKMKLKDVLKFQQRMLDNKSRSTAVGGYQFLKKTLTATMQTMRLTGEEVWDPDLQDRMGIQLMKGRGLDRYLAGYMTAEDFANNLAREWASLPVVTALIGSEKFVLKPGQSYYAGDGLNKAHHDPKVFLSLVKAIREADPATSSEDDTSKDEAPHAPPVTPPVETGFWAWLKRLFRV